MTKALSYRQKLTELASIYKIAEVFDKKKKFTTYEIELELLKNNVPIPSRRGYIFHVIINEIYEPTYNFLKKTLPININLDKNIKKKFDAINNILKFICSSISNFFKTLTIIIVKGLNNVYYFKVNEENINKYILRSVYVSFLLLFVFGGFYLKEYISTLDSFKISLEIKSDRNNDKNFDISKDSRNQLPETIVKKPKENIEKDTLNKLEDDYKLNVLTVLNLFEDYDYNLDFVRDSKLVKPIYFTRLPNDLDTIRGAKKKKETFLQIILPLVVAENSKIEKDRKYLFEILKQNKLKENRDWLNKKYLEYKVSQANINELIEKMDVVPVSIALAQAAKESGWGTSRFALEGNAIYGQWTWKGDGIEPLYKNDYENHQVLKFPILRASVKAYIANLNIHSGYKNFREKRAELRIQNKLLNGVDLVHTLENYAETGKEYTKILLQIIEQNDLDELETVTIDDLKEKKDLKI